MTEPKPPHKKSVGNHDNCDDCKRQKKENQALIAIYQKLQDVEQKSVRLRHALQSHRNSLVINRSFYKSLTEKIQMMPLTKKNQQSHEIEKLGFDIAAVLIEKQKKSNLQKENERLKAVITQMQSNKSKNEEKSKDYISNSLNFERKPSWKTSKLNETFKSNQNSEMKTKNAFFSCEMQKMQETMLSESNNSCSESKTTHSSAFDMKPDKNKDLIKYNDLNLWLYENEKNLKLEQELYLTREVKTKFNKTRREHSILPALQSKR